MFSQFRANLADLVEKCSLWGTKNCATRIFTSGLTFRCFGDVLYIIYWWYWNSMVYWCWCMMFLLNETFFKMCFQPADRPATRTLQTAEFSHRGSNPSWYAVCEMPKHITFFVLFWNLSRERERIKFQALISKLFCATYFWTCPEKWKFHQIKWTFGLSD